MSNGVVSLSLPEGLPVCSFVGPSLQPLFVQVSEETANAGAAVATIIMAAIRAATINKPMRLITLYPFLTTSTQRFSSQAVSGRMCICGGWARCVCLYLATNKRPALCLEFSRKLTSAQHPFLFSLSLSPKTKNRPLDPMVLCVAGCTTGSLCPWYPYLRDKVHSLYLIARASSFLAKKHNKANGQSLCFCAPKPCKNALNTEILAHLPSICIASQWLVRLSTDSEGLPKIEL